MERWEDLAEKLISEKKYGEALELCEKQKSMTGTVYYIRSKCNLKKGFYEAALKDIEDCLKTVKTTMEEQAKLAEIKAAIFWETDRLGEAVKMLEDEASSNKSLMVPYEQYKKKYQEEYGLPYGEETMKKIEEFIAWLRENGAEFGKIRMKYYGPDYRGVHAFQAIDENEVFLKVPKKLIITSQMGKETEMGAKVAKSGVSISWDYLAYITIFLLTQFSDKESWWKPFMDVYPRLVNSFPMFYSKEEKELLRGSPMMEQIDSELKEIKEEYDSICQAVPEFSKKFSEEDYAKNKTLVISRIFYVTIHGATERIMVPLADMFNHHYDKLGQTYWRYNNDDDSFIVNAQKSIPLGDAICENYGHKPNYRFLFYYGFLIDHNQKNAVYIKLYFNKEDTQLKVKEQMIGAYEGSYIKNFRYFEQFSDNEKCNNKFLGYLRFVEYDGDLNALSGLLVPPLKGLKDLKYGRRKMKLPFVSVENEKKMLKKLKQIAEIHLAKYPNSYEDDVKMLQKEDLSFNVRNCLILRSGEKKILKQMIDMAENGLKYLEDPSKGYHASIKTTPYFSYFRTTLIPYAK